MTRAPRELLEFLHRHDPAIQSLALAVRTVVHRELAPCHEYIFEMRSKVLLLYGATEHVIADGICQIGVFARHVTLAFPRGVDFHDPAGILEGSGKGMRQAFLRQARRRAGLKRRRGDAGGEVVTRVKQTPRGIV